MVIADLTEAELVGRIRQRLPDPPPWLLVGIGDDAAVVEPERNRVEVLTVDALVEGVHFDRRFTPAAAIGHRALAANLSDIAAMGAAPRLALLSLALPPSLRCADFEEVVSGLAALARQHRVHVIGGNLTRSPGPLMVDITVVGSVKRRQALTRGGARPGDEIYVTGTLGAAAAGLQLLAASAETAAAPSTSQEPLVRSYLYPEPRLRVGTLLSRNRAAAACMDLSDGLADAVWRIAEASGIGAAIDADALPIHPEARRWFEGRGADPVLEAVKGGDDYELLFASRPRLRGRLRAVVRHADVPFTRIGAFTPEGGVVLRRSEAGRPTQSPLPRGFSHFG